MATNRSTPVAPSSIQQIRAAAAALRASKQGAAPATQGLGFLARGGLMAADVVNGFGDARDAYELRRAERI